MFASHRFIQVEQRKGIRILFPFSVKDRRTDGWIRRNGEREENVIGNDPEKNELSKVKVAQQQELATKEKKRRRRRRMHMCWCLICAA